MTTCEDYREEVFQKGLKGIFPSYEERRQSLLEGDKDTLRNTWYTKEGVMRARFVRFEEIRALNLLYRRLCAFATENCVRGVYCKIREKHDEKEHESIHGDISKVTQLFRKKPEELFSTNIASTIQDKEVHEYIEYSLKEHLRSLSINSITKSVIESEIQNTVNVLRENNRRPALSHRAEGFGSVEASKEALYSAIEEGVSEIEFDVRMCSDKVPVVHHDVSLIAINGTDQRVPEISSKEFLSLETRTGECLATLEDVFSIIVEENNAVTRLHIDIKDFDPDFLDNIIDLIHKYDMEHRVVIVSWLPQALQYAYERDYTLVYSFSFFPEVRGISRFILRRIEKMYKNDNVPLFGKVATFVSKIRSSHRGRATEIITDTILLSAEKHWKDLGKNGKDSVIVGKHHLGLSRLGTTLDRRNMMVRVVQGGYVNILAFEEIFDGLCMKIGYARLCRTFISILDKSRKPALARLARKFEKIGIRVSVYDLDKRRTLEDHFDNFETHHVQGGVVFTNNPSLVPRLR